MKILIVEDDKHMRITLDEALSDAGYETFSIDRGERAIQLVPEYHPDIVLLDMRLPGIDGLETLKQIKNIDNRIVVIMMTAFGDIDTAVESMRLGAHDFITKPFRLSMIQMTLKNVSETLNLKEEIQQLREASQARYSLDKIVGKSRNIIQIKSLIKRISQSPASSVMITGDSGTGKELIACAVHFNSVTKSGPFMDINCAAIPDTLLESNLFGHVKGAFTDAVSEQKGLFERAQGGTLFLDEIGEMKPGMQVKLLRVIEQRSFRRVGGYKSYDLNCRIIAATNQDLLSAVKDGTFREDLYYRLNVVPIRVFPLIKRKIDIPVLVEHYLTYYAEELKQPIKKLQEKVIERFIDYAWPGNVRELKNTIERFYILCPETVITPDDLPPELFRKTESLDESSELEAPFLLDQVMDLSTAEKIAIRNALNFSDGNKSRAARILKISRPTLRKKIKEFGIE